ncbi:1-phosphatidylinositol-3-phosphate 5-kinase, partial [Quaeritorhiza haematococci]
MSYSPSRSPPSNYEQSTDSDATVEESYYHNQRRGGSSSTTSGGTNGGTHNRHGGGSSSGGSKHNSLEKNKTSLKLIRRLRNIGSEGQSQSQTYWMRDDKCKECYECKQSFTTFRRKHHCRVCGQIFCHKCSSIISGERFGHSGDVRACNFCAKLEAENKSESSTSQEQWNIPSHLYNSILPYPIPRQNSLQQQSSQGQTQSGTGLRSSQQGQQQFPSPASNPSTSLSSNESYKSKLASSQPGDSTSLDRIQKMLTNSIFSSSKPKTPAPSVTGADDRSAVVPFRKTVEDDEKPPGVDLSQENLMDPEIAPFVTDDEDEQVNGPDGWTSMPVLNFLASNASDMTGPSVSESTLRRSVASFEDTSVVKRQKTAKDDAESVVGVGGMAGSAGADGAAGGGTSTEDLKPPISGAADRPKRRSFTAGHPRLSKYSARAVSRQLSASTLSNYVHESGDVVPELDEKTGTKSVVTRHRRKQSTQPNVELNAASLQHMRRLLWQVLNDSEIPQAEQWKAVIIKLMLKVCDNVHPDIKGGDEIDIRHYVKIKKVPGGLPRDSRYVHGVVCSKNVGHKRMHRDISNPKIMLLTFPLEYQRVENQFLSLEPLLSQEREHVQNLVKRLMALKPDIILVERNVSRLAMELLLQENVIVAHNVKPSVIEALARCTRADIISSIDKLALEPRLGTCESFNVRTFVSDLIPGYRKTYLFFDGCPKELGCTLVMRGANNDVLTKIKQITDLLVFVVYNLKLETFLFRDQFAMTPVTESESDELFDALLDNVKRSLSPSPDNSRGYGHTNEEEGEIEKALRPYENTILSASPHVKFPPPYLLRRLREAEIQASRSKRDRSKSENNSVKQASVETRMSVDNSEDDAAPPSQLQQSQQQQQQPPDLTGLGSKLSLQARAGLNYLLENSDNINPFAHQNLLVLYSIVCTPTSVPCRAPEIFPIEYYRETDMTLGRYLEELCRNASYPCPAKMCDRPMLNHFRSYAHNQGRVNVVIEEFPSPVPGLENKISMWSFCRICSSVTPVVPMSEETWKYSFGKYLELTFYHTPLTCRADMCPHNIHTDHIRYFGYQNLAVRFEYESIDLLEVSVPPMRLQVNARINAKLKQQDFDNMRERIALYYDSLADRIKTFVYDFVLPSKVAACREALAEMARKVIGERKYTLQLLQQTHVTSSQGDTLAPNAVLKVLLENVIAWDNEFNGFARTYLQADTRAGELRRVTAAQLRKMFADRDYGDAARVAAALTNMSHDPANMEYADFADGGAWMVDPKYLPALGSSPTAAHTAAAPSPLLSPTASSQGREAMDLESLIDLIGNDDASRAARRYSMYFLKHQKVWDFKPSRVLPSSEDDCVPTFALPCVNGIVFDDYFDDEHSDRDRLSDNGMENMEGVTGGGVAGSSSGGGGDVTDDDARSGIADFVNEEEGVDETGLFSSRSSGPYHRRFPLDFFLVDEEVVPDQCSPALMDAHSAASGAAPGSVTTAGGVVDPVLSIGDDTVFSDTGRSESTWGHEGGSIKSFKTLATWDNVSTVNTAKLSMMISGSANNNGTISSTISTTSSATITNSNVGSGSPVVSTAAVSGSSPVNSTVVTINVSGAPPSSAGGGAGGGSGIAQDDDDAAVGPSEWNTI